jgi:ABC-type nitrate/sulfonate/bicarbonate transport system substrate-binding protein
VAAALRAVRKAQQALQADPGRATEAARQCFPPQETALIAELIRRDLPYYEPTISAEVVSRLQDFAQHVGLLAAPVPYEQVVAVEFSHLWER